MARRRITRRTKIGVPGNTEYSGFSISDDYLSKLDGTTGRVIYDEMRRSDPSIAMLLDMIGLPIRRAQWTVEPADDSPLQVEIAETLERQLLTGLKSTWDDVIRNALLMLPFGFAIAEKIWSFRDGFWWITDLDARLPASIIEWRFDQETGDLICPIQQDTNGDRHELPVNKIVIWTLNKEGSNYEGIPMLRRLYKPWQIKDIVEKVNAIRLERFGAGIPVMHVPASVTDGTNAWTDTEKLLEEIHANEKSFVIEPEGYVFRIEGAGGGDSQGGADGLPTIKHYEETIAKAALQMFANLGTSQTGSRALGGTFIDFFLDAEQAVADYLAERLQKDVIEEWVDLNWNVDGLYPQLTVGRLKDLALESLAALATAGLLTPDLATENQIRREQHLPEREEDAEPPAITEDDDEPEDEPPDEDEREDEEDRALAAAVAEAHTEILAIRERQCAALVDKLSNGARLPELVVPYRSEMFDTLKPIARRLFKQFPDEYLQLAVDKMAADLKANMSAVSVQLKRRGKTGSALRRYLEESVQHLPDDTEDVIRTAFAAGRALETFDDKTGLVWWETSR